MNAASIFDGLVSFFKAGQWPYTQVGEQPILQIGFRGDNGEWLCYADARAEYAQVLFYSICPTKTPVDRRITVAEFITRANFGMMIGNFELDFEDGEVRYKTSLAVEGFELNDEVIKSIVFSNVAVMDRYLPFLTQVINGQLSPRDAIAKAEG